MAVLDELKIDPEQEIERITAFIRAEREAAGRSGLIVGLSGGLDSSVAACLCVRAAGKENVHGFFLSYRASSIESRHDAAALAEFVGIACPTIDLSPAVDALKEKLGADDRVRLGNLTARMRMIALYDRSAEHDGLVVGTGNRTEWMLGYTTLYGDSACAFAPLRHLYKCQIRQLGVHLHVPGHIVTKPPSAGLWPGQTDEDELGFSYDDVDWLLYNLLDKERSDSRLKEMGFEPGFVDRVKDMIARSEFKRRMPNALPAGR
jgi:NAD+ synthase